MNKPYHERPDWILKSIVYFCDNYTIDGKSLRKFKRGAIVHYIARDHGTTIDGSFNFATSPQRHTFWSCLGYLQGLDFRCGGTGPGDCKPWTDYEKRKIAKMPRVK
jgi:hypothetical protein